MQDEKSCIQIEEKIEMLDVLGHFLGKIMEHLVKGGMLLSVIEP